jgi:hypothetical protein
MNIAYELGQRAHKAGAECDPFDDAIFWTYLEDKDLPIVPTVKDYLRGYDARQTAVNKKAQARRDTFRIV